MRRIVMQLYETALEAPLRVRFFHLRLVERRHLSRGRGPRDCLHRRALTNHVDVHVRVQTGRSHRTPAWALSGRRSERGTEPSSYCRTLDYYPRRNPLCTCYGAVTWPRLKKLLHAPSAKPLNSAA
jgi:hypothetical protein